MALYIPHSIFHLARLLYVRPENFGPYYVLVVLNRVSGAPLFLHINHFLGSKQYNLYDKGKGKVSPVCAMKSHRGAEAQRHSFLTSAPDGGEWFTSRPGRFTPETRRRCALYRRLGGPQSRYGCSGEQKILFPPTAIRAPDRIARSLVAKPTTLIRLLEFIGYMGHAADPDGHAV